MSKRHVKWSVIGQHICAMRIERTVFGRRRVVVLTTGGHRLVVPTTTQAMAEAIVQNALDAVAE